MLDCQYQTSTIIGISTVTGTYPSVDPSLTGLLLLHQLRTLCISITGRNLHVLQGGGQTVFRM